MCRYSLSEVNQLSQANFVAVFGAIFEATPEIAAQTWQHRPFTSLQALHQTMCRLVERRDRVAQLRLLQAHPDLGSKAKMAPASVQEQATVGLDTLSAEEFQRFQRLNQTYQERFGFPFIVAVRNYSSQESILQAFEVRSQNTLEQEHTTAMLEVMQIAWYRLRDIILENGTA